MKRHSLPLITLVLALLVILPHAHGQGKGAGQGKGKGRGGMPEEMREVIHGLFDGHEAFQRKVEVTATGYRATTTSEDKEVARLLQTHVRQMEKRLKSGLMVRRWDPAYEEFVRHYDDINIEITNVEGGVSIVATGKTEDARRVARNHAGIIGRFIERGWSEHDETHPAVLSGSEVPRPVTDAVLGETKSIHRVGEVFLASQPGLDDLKEAEERGFKTVLSFRHTDEVDFDESREVEALGMSFVHLPWNGEAELTDDIFDSLRATLQTAERPLLLHCGSANRAAAGWLVWRVLDEGVDAKKAVEEARAMGLSSEAYEARALDYIGRRKSAPALSDEIRQECLELGEKASSLLMANLQTQLKAALAGGDTAAAIVVCRTAAQPVTEAAGREFDGVTVMRTSLKTRNTTRNKPDAFDSKLLTRWEAIAGGSPVIEPEVLPLHENRVRYYRPIFVKELCLKCHGAADAIEAPLLNVLTESYPDDQATGYRVGDLRGAFRVEIDLEKALK